MKTRSSRGPDFVYSAELLEASLTVLGRSDGVLIGKAMRNSKLRLRIREEQFRLATQKRRPALEAPAGAAADKAPLPKP